MGEMELVELGEASASLPEASSRLEPDEDGQAPSFLIMKVASLGALGGFLFGYDLALIGGALLLLKDELHLSEWEQEAIVGFAKLGAVLGTFLGGAMMSCYGRKATMWADGVFFFVGPLLMGISSASSGLMAGRLLVGVGIGVSAVVVPAYVAETAPAKHRGALVSLYEALLCVGMLCASLVNFALHDVPGGWRWMVAMPAAPALVLMLAASQLPESPRWLVTRRRVDEAVEILHGLRTGVPRPAERDTWDADVACEVLELWRSVMDEQQLEGAADGRADAAGSSTSLRTDTDDSAVLSARTEAEAATAAVEAADMELLHTLLTQAKRGEGCGTRENSEGNALDAEHMDRWRILAEHKGVGRTLLQMFRTLLSLHRSEERGAFALAVGLAAFNQIVPSTSIINYAPEIISSRMGVEVGQAILMSSLIGATKLLGVIIGMAKVDSLGRRPLLIGGSFGCAAALGLLAVAVAVGNVGLALFAMCLFLFAYSLSWASGFWVLVSELFSMRRKSAASSAATAVMFACGAFTDLTFLSMESSLGGGAFVVFAFFAALSGCFVALFLPETKGRTLLEVQALLKTSALLPTWMRRRLDFGVMGGDRQPFVTFDQPAQSQPHQPNPSGAAGSA